MLQLFSGKRTTKVTNIFATKFLKHAQKHVVRATDDFITNIVLQLKSYMTFLTSEIITLLFLKQMYLQFGY